MSYNILGGKKDLTSYIIDPVKLIYKYKNNNFRVQYQVYIFLGNHDFDKNILKLHKKIEDMNLYDSLLQLDVKEINILQELYGDTWYRKLFISHHILATFEAIRTNPAKKKDIISKYNQQWYDTHIATTTFLDRTFFNYQALIKQEKEMKKKLQKLEKLESDIDTDIIQDLVSEKQEPVIQQEGGEDDDEEEEEEEEEEIVEEEEEEVFIESEASDDEVIIEEEVDKNAAKLSNLVMEAITVNENKEKQEQLEKMTPFDESKNDKPYDESLSNTFTKRFVYNQFIYPDDAIKKIKQKICAGILFSNVYPNQYLIPSRLYLWSEYEYIERGKENIKHEKLMLGQKWIVRNEILPIKIEPDSNIKNYESIKGNLRSLRDNMRKYSSRIKFENDENNILEDYQEFINNNEIYMIDIYHELGLEYKSEVDLVRNLYDVYIKIYFPFISNEDFNQIIGYLNKKSSSTEINKITSTYQTISLDLLLENEIMINVERLRRDICTTDTDICKHKDLFKPNYVTQTSINLNTSYINHGISSKIDLYRIFDNFLVSNKYPFVQYQTMDAKLVFKFYQMTDETDKQTIMTKWFENAPYGLSFKVRIDKFKDGDKYIAINLNESGRIDYKTQWKEEDEIDFDYIKNTFDDVINLLKKINDENIKVQFNMPETKHFKYAFINTIQQFMLPNKFNINHNDLSDFSRYFFPYISVVVDPRKRSSTQNPTETSKYGTYLRYKRVSKFDNDARIDHRIIHFLRNYEYIPKLLADELSRQFNITEKEAVGRIEDVRARYPVLKKTRKILKKFENIPKYKPPGIGIDLQGKSRDNYKIRITGARSKEQLIRINQFIQVLIHLYIETYLYKNKKYQKLKDMLKQLTNIAKRRNKVDDIVDEDKEIKNIKQITKLDKSRVGFKPEKGQNHWTRSCQNSGKKRRQPIPFKDVNELTRLGYILNKESAQYEKKVRIGKNDVIVKAAALSDNQGGQLYWTCETNNNNKFVHIGFLSRSQNPSGICMPCCFKKDPALSKNVEKKEYHLKCIGQSSEAGTSRKTIGDQLYILQDTNKMLPERLGFLPKYLDMYFNIFLNNIISLKNHYLVKTDGYFLKFGSIQDEYPYLNAVASVFSMSANDVKNKVIAAIRNDPDQLIFTSLNNGDIKTQFHTIENYIHFLETNEVLEPKIMNDLVSVPGILYPGGLNIYVFEKSSDTRNDFIVNCWNSENMVNFRDPQRVNIFIVHENKNYFPIFFIKKQNNKPKRQKESIIIDIERFFYFSNLLEHVWSYFESNCTGINLSDSTLPIAKILISNIDSKDIIGQIVDVRNKCRYIITKNVILPVKPSGCLYNIPIIQDYSKYILSLYDTLQALSKIKNNEYRPKGIIFEKNNGQQIITALSFSKSIYLPINNIIYDDEEIQRTMSTFGIKNFDISELSLFDKIDEEIVKKDAEMLYDERVSQVNRNKFNMEGYELFRLELSNFLANNQNEKEKLLKAIESKDSIQVKKTLYSFTSKSLETELVNAVKQSGGFIDVQADILSLQSYHLKNNRELCSSLNKEKCTTNFHCSLTNSEQCVFRVSRDNLVDYVNRITNELLHVEAKMKEILNIDNYYVSDIISYDIYTHRPEQKIIKSDNNNILKIMTELFGKKNIPIIGKKKVQRIEKHQIEENLKHRIRKAGDKYYQTIINHNPLFRAYANGFYWLKNNGANIAYRNIGYFSELQTNLANYFRSLVFDWILDTNNQPKLQSYMKEFTSFKESEFKHQLANSKDVTSLGQTELYILNQVHKIPIALYDQYNSLIIVIDDGIKHNIKEAPIGCIQIQYNLSDLFEVKKVTSLNVTKVTAIYDI